MAKKVEETVEQKLEQQLEKDVPATDAVNETVANEVANDDEPLFALDTDELMASGARGGGKKIRPHVGYTLIGKPMVPLPTQARTLILIIHKNISKKHPAISEPELLKVLDAARASGELETVQPAWRIFQYYRERLKDAKVLKEVSLAAAPAETK